ncbi:DUF1758 domain-containing protein [Trichonephila clavata]|uniref:DUF1758 domain-containing protein n=1 Tax=Trichonephila clavata TaxID=2740835 RepID=A0A8X6FEA9_TRICU|nr:DUF1758 domain-containing protein [Trichonephila clavata]
MSEDKDRVACLKRKRSILRTAVTNTVTKLEHELLETGHIDVDKLEEILEILVTKFESLKCIDNELEPLFGEIEFEEEYTKTEEYNDKVTLTKFRVNKRIRELNKNVSNFPANVSHDVEKINQVYQPNINIEENSVRIKLPKLCIPKFYGDVNQWLNFWNSFESAIHKNVHLNKIDKFNYLKSYLGGTALTLPQDILIEFNQLQNEKPYTNVNDLLNFLSLSLRSRERAALISCDSSSQRFTTSYPSNNSSFEAQRDFKNHKSDKTKQFSTSQLISTDIGKQNKKGLNCIFCDSSIHESLDCDYAYNLSLEERKNILFKKGGCFKCLGAKKHISRFCKANITCCHCSGKHSPLMCFVKYKQKENDKNINPKADESRPLENTVLTNQSTFNEIYLQTLVVRISNKGLNHFVRVIIDSGSTKSYISKFVAEIMGLKSIDSISLNKRYKYRQRIRYDLEKRFRIEYLGYLRQSSKHKKENSQVQVGDIVFVSSDNLKKIDWPLARVIQLFPSKDGDVRLAKVRMKNGEFLRPIDRLIPLELSVELDAPKNLRSRHGLLRKERV